MNPAPFGPPPPGAAPPPQQQDPRALFGLWSGLSPLQMEALGITAVRCLCGQCAGVRVQLDTAIHFTRAGLERTPRADAARVTEPAPAPASALDEPPDSASPTAAQ